MSEKVEVVVAIGTRPDVIKMEPVITALGEAGIGHKVWWSGQGGDIQPDLTKDFVVEDMGRWSKNGDLAYNIGRICGDFGHFLHKSCMRDVRIVLVHGDDATAYACAIAAHALDIPVGHVEAGMRTYERDPWPEEDFRRAIGLKAQIHFCPSEIEADNLRSERTRGTIHVTGNTINDVLARTHKFGVLVTVHRRENALQKTQELLDALSEFQAAWPERANVEIVKHPNWQNRYNLPHNLTFLDPIRDHEEFVEKLRQSDVVVTDSGGLQEECAFLGVECVVYREKTERKSLQIRGLVQIYPNADIIRQHLNHKITDQTVYGTGNTAEKIVEIVRVWLNARSQRQYTPPLVNHHLDGAFESRKPRPQDQFAYPYITPEMERADQEQMGKYTQISYGPIPVNRAAWAKLQNPDIYLGKPSPRVNLSDYSDGS